MLVLGNLIVRKGFDHPLLAVDFDDVLFDCNGALQLIISNEFNDKSSYMEFVTKYPHTKNEIFRFLYGSYHHNCTAICGAYDTLSYLANIYRMVVITGRSESTKKQTEEWLRSNFPTLFSKIYFTNTFLSNPWEEEKRKVNVCIDIGVNTLIDDSMEEAVEVSSAGIQVFLFDRLWNRVDIPVPMIYRVKGWDHILHKLSKKGGGNGT